MERDRETLEKWFKPAVELKQIYKATQDGFTGDKVK